MLELGPELEPSTRARACSEPAEGDEAIGLMEVWVSKRARGRRASGTERERVKNMRKLYGGRTLWRTDSGGDEYVPGRAAQDIEQQAIPCEQVAARHTPGRYVYSITAS